MTGRLEPRETRSYTMTAVTTMVSMARTLVMDLATADENAAAGLQSISTQRSAMYAPMSTPISGIMLQPYLRRPPGSLLSLGRRSPSCSWLVRASLRESLAVQRDLHFGPERAQASTNDRRVVKDPPDDTEPVGKIQVNHVSGGRHGAIVVIDRRGDRFISGGVEEFKLSGHLQFIVVRRDGDSPRVHRWRDRQRRPDVREVCS